MTDEEQHWEVGSSGELQRKYGLYAENWHGQKLDPAHVPQHLHRLIPLAELWGIPDDIMREDFVGKAPKEAQQDLVQAVKGSEQQIFDWLAGVEPNAQDPSDEYVAFTAMTMAADLAEGRLAPPALKSKGERARIAAQMLSAIDAQLRSSEDDDLQHSPRRGVTR